MPLSTAITESVDPSVRDGVAALVDRSPDAPDSEPPTIVSISDIHGYLDAARSALLTLADHPEFEPVVVADDDGRLHWADNNYVLVFNGDLVDRGPENRAVLELVDRLITEAPGGRVRVTLGNHEASMLCRDQFGFTNWYSGRVDDDARRQLCAAITAGHVVAAYRGYTYTYAHAGGNNQYTAEAVNESLLVAATELEAAIGTADDLPTQGDIITSHSQVLGVGKHHPKGPDAGLIWIDFNHLSVDAPPQIVGHTRHATPQTTGAVHCQNVIRDTLEEPGGEGVFVETPHELRTLLRQSDRGVTVQSLSATD